MHFLYFAIFGLVVGAIAKFLMPGRDPGGFVITAIIGMIGSMLGAFIGQAVGMYHEGTDAAGWVMSVIGAVALLAIYRVAMGRRLA